MNIAFDFIGVCYLRDIARSAAKRRLKSEDPCAGIGFATRYKESFSEASLA